MEDAEKSFNSTRWISNFVLRRHFLLRLCVSTPHGGLATLCPEVGVSKGKGVSTPHGGLATISSQKHSRSYRSVSTPHGGLAPRSNSRRWEREYPVSTPHGGLATSTHHIKNNKTYQAFCQGGTPLK